MQITSQKNDIDIDVANTLTRIEALWIELHVAIVFVTIDILQTVDFAFGVKKQNVNDLIELICTSMSSFRLDPSTTLDMEASVTALGGVCCISPSSIGVLTSCGGSTTTIFKISDMFGSSHLDIFVKLNRQLFSRTLFKRYEFPHVWHNVVTIEIASEICSSNSLGCVQLRYSTLIWPYLLVYFLEWSSHPLAEICATLFLFLSES